ncbi:uncharacterized protein PHALS_06729 [Plasmopara halstedii]|uniref:Uncharacterized protein n=1 Tax=Plasmopara halstedii TaxID=4781 RepID=A0A0P1B2H9_PLAHL|nr:uncharacterized protein PHALS_06729 [Plasmopara halstedii]CEG48938.1 hypothetical protein PHALS_06729 [Plasmopara halstedii]|eukprot:XP_024585307.1 hypothetical protein PHALS_06729 [Plasmopara halstedii]
MNPAPPTKMSCGTGTQHPNRCTEANPVHSGSSERSGCRYSNGYDEQQPFVPPACGDPIS